MEFRTNLDKGVTVGTSVCFHGGTDGRTRPIH